MWKFLLDEFKDYILKYSLNKRYGLKPPKGKKEVYALYGDPANCISPKMYWREHGQFVHINKEAYAHIPWLRQHGGFWAHKLVTPMLRDIFQEIANKRLAGFVHTFDGCYCHRNVRGGRRLSFHAFGAAVDLNASENPLGSESRMHTGIIDIFKNHGWIWGGDFKRKDPMHFQFGSY